MLKLSSGGSLANILVSASSWHRPENEADPIWGGDLSGVILTFKVANV